MDFSTKPSPSVSAALDTRITVRDFLDKPVPDNLLREILTTAQRSPSGGNLQPWSVHVMTGEALAVFKADAIGRVKSGQLETPTYPAYPSPLWEPHRSWRYKLGEDMYGLLGIPKDDKLARMMWLARNSEFFGAPVGIIITGDTRLNMPQYMDVGIYLQSLMLLAREHGLHSAPQGWWRNWHSVCHEHLSIEEGQEVLVGLSLGYANPNAPVNSLYADRAPMESRVQFYT